MCALPEWQQTWSRTTGKYLPKQQRLDQPFQIQSVPLMYGCTGSWRALPVVTSGVMLATVAHLITITAMQPTHGHGGLTRPPYKPICCNTSTRLCDCREASSWSADMHVHQPGAILSPAYWKRAPAMFQNYELYQITSRSVSLNTHHVYNSRFANRNMLLTHFTQFTKKFELVTGWKWGPHLECVWKDTPNASTWPALLTRDRGVNKKV